LKKSTVYNVWIDAAPGPVIVDTNMTPAQSNASIYSIYIATNNGPRVLIVSNFVSPLDYIGFSGTVGIPGTNYDRFILTHGGTAFTGNNIVLVDDLYISTNGFNSSVPVPVSTFNAPTPIVIAFLSGTNLLYDGASSIFSFNWTDTGCGPYSIQRTLALGGGTNDWQTIATGLTVQNFQDFFSIDQTNAFYRITSP
jgi:hypothetical protein